MSDNKFSIDDILNEYSKKQSNVKKPKPSFDLDEFITSLDNNSGSEKKLTTLGGAPMPVLINVYPAGRISSGLPLKTSYNFV